MKCWVCKKEIGKGEMTIYPPEMYGICANPACAEKVKWTLRSIIKSNRESRMTQHEFEREYLGTWDNVRDEE